MSGCREKYHIIRKWRPSISVCLYTSTDSVTIFFLVPVLDNSPCSDFSIFGPSYDSSTYRVIFKYLFRNPIFWILHVCLLVLSFLYSYHSQSGRIRGPSLCLFDIFRVQSLITQPVADLRSFDSDDFIWVWSLKTAIALYNFSCLMFYF